MATPSHCIPLRAILVALPLLSLLVTVSHHLLYRPSSPLPPPLLTHLPLRLPLRLPLLRLWLHTPSPSPTTPHGFVFLDAPAPAAVARALPHGIYLRVSADASRFPYTHPRGLPSAVRVARIAGELISALDAEEDDDDGNPTLRPAPRWLVLADDDTAFVVPNLLRVLNKYDHREPWYIGARSESAAQNAWHGFGMAYGGAGVAISWTLARRLGRVIDSCVLRYPHVYGSDARIFACLGELGVELTHEPGFHQVREFLCF
nr:unnamed protein product [Digitaria exilis]